MQQEILTFNLSMPFRLGIVNCYLVTTDTGYVLIDTGSSNQRSILEDQLEAAGCKPGNLKLIVLTHGDFDHTGNAVYLRQKFAAPLAMREEDGGMLEQGDMFWNRKKGNRLLRKLVALLFRFDPSNMGKADLYLKDGADLSDYGLEAKVLFLEGHSKGSLGVLMPNGDLFCGDLFENVKQPKLNSLMDDGEAALRSVERLKGSGIKTIYPGHGKVFTMEEVLRGFVR